MATIGTGIAKASPILVARIWINIHLARIASIQRLSLDVALQVIQLSPADATL